MTNELPKAFVGIGTSAGGLAALQKFFALVPADSDLAYVVVIHLSPEYKSHLNEILQRQLKLPVTQVQKTIPLKKNHVYIIPPNANLNAIDTHLRLSKLEEIRQQRAPIDHFFRTLAENKNENAIGVILTGTGSDGTLGLRRIKELGGLTIVQDPTDAEFDGMPQSALSECLVDHILPLNKIPEAILKYVNTKPLLPLPNENEGNEPSGEIHEILNQIFSIIQSQIARDFRHYKPSTILRRVSRRMQFNQIREPVKYLALLRRSTREVQILADDLLITVTSFFRDTEVFQSLEKHLIPKLFDKKTENDTIRVWAVGCATGEEAYSMAILLFEEASRREVHIPIQVFASDLHQNSMDKAREGFYQGDIETDVTPERLNRFFQKEKGGYRVSKDLREMVVFAKHNILSDPPFSRVDLLSCRNLLIYLQRNLQKKVIELFHYALQTQGYLVLGTSENIEIPELFHIVDKKLRVYQKRNVPAPEPRLPVFPLAKRDWEALVKAPENPEPKSETDSYGKLHHQMLEQFGPPSVLISPDDNIVNFSSRAGRYLVHPGGTPTNNVYKLIREELRIELRAALPPLRGKKQSYRSKPIQVRFNGDTASVVLELRGANNPSQEGFVLLLFDEYPISTLDKPNSDYQQIKGNEGIKAHLEGLEAEKDQVYKRLQAVIEEYESGQEEIKSSNEELQSANEELRSTLEELETSKEELQSMNEELQTVNQENRNKVEELDNLSNDLQNLLASTEIGTLYLDRELRILRFTPRVTELFNIRLADRGRPLSDFTRRIGYDTLGEDARNVYKMLIPIEKEIKDDSGKWYLTRVLPCRNKNDKISGVVITFVEITLRKKTELALIQAKEFSEQIIETLPEPLLILNHDLRVHSANDAFYKQFRESPEYIMGHKIHEMKSGQWNIPELINLFENILPEKKIYKGFPIQHDFERLGKRYFLLNCRKIDSLNLILVGFHDITKREDSINALRRNEDALNTILDVLPAGVAITDTNGKIIRFNQAAMDLWGIPQESEYWKEYDQWVGWWPDSGKQVEPDEWGISQAIQFGKITKNQLIKNQRFEDKQNRYFLNNVIPLRNEKGEITGSVAAMLDVTERLSAEKALQKGEKRLRVATEAAGLGVFEWNANTDVATWENAQMYEIFGISIGSKPYTRNELINKAMHPDDVEGFIKNIEESLQFQSPFRYKCRIRRRNDGEERWIEYFTQFLDEGGDSKIMVGVVDDVTDQTIAEEKLREANRHKDEFLAMLGHELRNPLAAIRTATDLLYSNAQNDAKQMKSLFALQRQTHHMSRIIDGLLEVSRIAKGKVQLNRKALDLNDLVVNVLGDCKSRIASRGLELKTDFIDEKIWVRGDEVRLAQVIDNLISNSLKFTMPPGTILVSVTKQNEQAVLKVKDTGAGIRKEIIGQIFESFHQEKQEIDRSSGGLGLGLSLAKGLVELHDGTIEAISEGPGSGAEFVVRIPQIPPPRVQKEKKPKAKAKNLRIIIIEDNADAGILLAELLEQEGHKTRVAETAPKALEMLQNEMVDVALCDLGLPGMNGYEFAKTVRNTPELQSLYLIALTGYSQPENRKKSTESGFDDFMIKPVDKDNLVNLLNQIDR